MTAPNNWRPGLPGVTNIRFGIPVGNGYYPPIWWRRWGRKVFYISVIVACLDLACRIGGWL